ncbi:TPA: DUF1642 domain-containing protein [Streptococcus pyogenes]
MNKQKLIRKYEDACFAVVPVDEVLEDLRQLYEPQKPVVLQYVADWYEVHKDELEINLYREVCQAEENYNCGGLTDFQEWLISGKTSPFSVLVNMNQFGYEVEKETKYRIKMKAARYNGFPQFLCEEDRGIFWGSVFDCRKTKFTRKELEDADFGWVFDCEGIKIEEVE